METESEAVSQQAENRDLLDKKALRRLILRLAWPTMTEMMLLQAAQMANMIMVGRLGAAAVAAVGLTSQPYMLAGVLFAAMNTGTSVIVARSTGAGNHKEARAAAGQSLLLNGTLAVFTALAAWHFAAFLLRAMGASAEVTAIGLPYARLVFLSVAFSAAASAMSAILRGAGDTRTPMKINLAAGCISVGLDFLLIYGHFGLPALGVLGAAVSTIIAMSFYLTAAFEIKARPINGYG